MRYLVSCSKTIIWLSSLPSPNCMYSLSKLLPKWPRMKKFLMRCQLLQDTSYLTTSIIYELFSLTKQFTARVRRLRIIFWWNKCKICFDCVVNVYWYRCKKCSRLCVDVFVKISYIQVFPVNSGTAWHV